MTKINFSVLITAIIIVIASSDYIKSLDGELYSQEYKGNEGKNQFTTNMKLIGGKRFGADLMWVKQVLDIGGQMGSHDDVESLPVEKVPLLIKENSEAISYLDPYFLGNYYFSGSVVAMIKIFNRLDIGIEILNRGIEYNTEDGLLKYYLGGIMAYSKGHSEEILHQFEGIVEKYRDDMITDVVAFVYEQKYKHTKDKEYLKKAYYYRTKLLDSKDAAYRAEAEKKIEEFGKLLKK